MKALVCDLKKVKLEKLKDKIHLHRMIGKKMAFVYVKFQKGAQESGIKHANEEFFFVVRGLIKAEVGGRSYTLQGGDVLFIPSNEPHSFIALKTTTVVCSFAPPITDKKARAIMKKIDS